MTAILALALMAASLAYLVGARQTAKHIGLGLLAAILGFWAARCALCWFSQLRESSVDSSLGIGWFWPIVILSVVLSGGIAWKTRSIRQKRKAELRGRHMHPRKPASPSAPSISADDDGVFP
jgi:hypothetical protein